jgi:cobyrinic acid a,c-diamide synthase
VPAVPIVTGALCPSQATPCRVRITVARDRAFTFYYEDNLDLLQAWGAELTTFSPLEDEDLPAGTQGVYIGGGFPEIFAAELAANRSLHGALSRAAGRHVPIYAECGGLMYLGQTLEDGEGHRFSMAGLAPFRSSMRSRQLVMGYRTVTSLRPTPILAAGTQLRGHEFHYSTLTRPVPGSTAAYALEGPTARREGFAHDSLLASYIHVHFGTDPAIAPRFVAACALGDA